MSDESLHSLIISTDDGEQAFELLDGPTTIGRSRQNHLVLRESSVSRQQCRLECNGDRVRVFDGGSRNVSRIRRASSGKVKNADGRILRDGDTLMFGRVEVRYRSDAAPLAGTPEARSKYQKELEGRSARRGDDAREETPVVGATPVGESPVVGAKPVSDTSSPVRPKPSRRAAERASPAASSAASKVSRTERREAPAKAPAGPRRRRTTIRVRKTSTADAATKIAVLLVFGGIAATAIKHFSPKQTEDHKTETVTEDTKNARPSERERELAKLLQSTREELSKLQRQQTAFEKELGGSKTSASTDEDDEAAIESRRRLVAMRTRIAELSKREQELRGNLEGVRTRPIGLSAGDDTKARRSIARRQEALRGRDTIGTDSGGGSGLLVDSGKEPDSSRWIRHGSDSDRDRDSTSTEVAKIPQRVELDKESYGKLTHNLKEAVGNYALPSSHPDDLEPDLTRVTRATGDLGAKALIEVYEYSQLLMKNMDTTVAMLQKRVDGLLAKAEETYGGSGKGQGSKGRPAAPGYGRRGHSQYLEQLQRLLELSEKKIQIKKRHRKSLLAFQGELGSRFSDLTGLETSKHFLKIFPKLRDNPELGQHLLSYFKRHKTLEAVPVLSKSLRVRDVALKQAVQSTLATIVGQDLGDSKAAWDGWYKANGRAKT